MARIIILSGHNEGKNDDHIRLPGTVLEIGLPESQLDLLTEQVRLAINLCNRVFVAKKVSEARSHAPAAPGSKQALALGCRCKGPQPGYTVQRYDIHPECIVHKGKWPTF